MKKKGFTLVELLAVIAILAILVILALPNVIGLYNSAKQESFLTEVKNLASSAEKQYMSNQVKGDNTRVFSSRGNKLEMTGKELDYYIELDSNGKIKTLKVSNGVWLATLSGGKEIADLTKSDLVEGTLDESDYGSVNIPEAVYCTYDGEMVQGNSYTTIGKYTYFYMQEVNFEGNSWKNITEDGWGVELTNPESTDPITSAPCTYINDKPVVSMSSMFQGSKATSIDVSNFNTSNVVNMRFMFYDSQATEIKGLENFDTSKVTDMTAMFEASHASNLDVSSFNTSKVTNMYNMFGSTKATEIKGLESFDTSNVTNMYVMFISSKANKIDISKWNLEKVENAENMFCGAAATEIKGLDKIKTLVNWSNYDETYCNQEEKPFGTLPPRLED